MGRPKLLLPIAGDTVIGCTARALQQGGADRVVVVTARDDEGLQEWAKERGWDLRINPRPSRGMLSSVQEGIEALGGAANLDVLLVCPADLPLLRSETVARVLRAQEESNTRLTTPRHADRRGHPLAIAGNLIDLIAGLDASVGLRQLLLDHPKDLLEVDVDDAGSIYDLDTPEDYRHLQGQLEGS